MKKYGRALLADSHLGMLGGVHSLLDAMFETVLMAADERSLLQAIATLKPDLVVVDLSLPCEGEANIVRRLMAKHPEVRVIVLSVHDEPTVAGQMLRTGAAGFVLKRSAATDLIPAVEAVMRGETDVCPALGPRFPDSGGRPPFGANEAAPGGIIESPGIGPKPNAHSSHGG
jgi:DNA-binding NarL/FixJ family response regulator